MSSEFFNDLKEGMEDAIAYSKAQPKPAQMPGEIIAGDSFGYPMWRRADDDYLILDGEARYVRADQSPVAWRVKDYADGWVIYQNKRTAFALASHTGALIQPLYAGESISAEAVQAALNKMGGER